MTPRRIPLLAAFALVLVGISFLVMAPFAYAAGTRSAVFAGGCFWCMEEAFDNVAGVVATTSGYTGGQVANPSYEQVSAGGTGHYESVKVEYDPGKVTYAQLLAAYVRNVDPFDSSGQFCDHGTQYQSVIFTSDPGEKAMAENALKTVADQFGKPVATKVLPEATFYPAEDYHQNFHVTTSIKYKFYKRACGRAERLQELWGKPSS